MAITYSNKVDIRGVAAEPIFEEVLFENTTIEQDLVTFEDDIKAETIFTEADADVTMQAFTCGEPTAAGSMTAWDALVTPKKVMFYDTFCPETLRTSRFKRDMKPGAWNMMSDEFERVVIGGIYAKKISLDFEDKFWNHISAATKTAIAALTAGSLQTEVSSREKTLAAALTTVTNVTFDGILAKLIYNNSNPSATSAVGGRIKVTGTTITSANIKDEYAKVYAAIPAVVLNNSSLETYIYAPKSHKQLITIANNVTSDFNRPFLIENGKYYYNSVEIKFVPLPENVMIAAPKQHLIWATDLKSDMQEMKLDKIANNREDMFIKVIATMETHIANQAFNVLYV